MPAPIEKLMDILEGSTLHALFAFTGKFIYALNNHMTARDLIVSLITATCIGVVLYVVISDTPKIPDGYGYAFTFTAGMFSNYTLQLFKKILKTIISVKVG